MGEYEVIIVGSSFAGLAVASQIKSGRVLLVDQKEIGEVGKSACGTIFGKMKDLGLESPPSPKASVGEAKDVDQA